MILHGIDWAFIIAYFVISLLIGILVTKRSSASVSEFFLSGRSMPWWLLGVSLVATTFSTDTPNCITDMLRTNGVAGNWVWWAFVVTGMATVFIYAKLWRRSGVLTDLEFYEIRYSGKGAAFLRGFRSIYLGVFFNILIMASVSLAAIKIGGVMFGFNPYQTLLISIVVTVAYSMLGGFLGVLLTDFFQFGVAMAGALYAGIYAVNLPEVGGLSQMLRHPAVRGHLSLFPDFSSGDYDYLLAVFIVPLAVQWWASWYPGSEPGGGGYVAQRMLAAKTENDAIGAVLSFNIMHYALRPWPWLLVGLASLIVFPIGPEGHEFDALIKAFPHIDPAIVRHDLAYPAMLTRLPTGWLGLVVASLIAAYMSTISTHLNWGSSYIVNDFWKRFVNPDASQKQLVFVGRCSILFLMIASSALALGLTNAFQNFKYMVLFAAGTGPIFLLRWFWWRINAASEIAAMVTSLLAAIYLAILHPHFFPGLLMPDWAQLCINVLVTTIAWMTVVFATPSTDEATLRSFYRLVHPGGPGWRGVVQRAAQEGQPVDKPGEKWDLPLGLLCMFLGCILIWGAVLATGYWIYANYWPASVLTVITLAAGLALMKLWGKMNIQPAQVLVEESTP